MEGLVMRLDADAFDKAVHGGLDDLPILAESGDLSVFAKPNATESGKGMVVITFTVKQQDGSMARVQATTTAALFDMAGAAVRGWRQSGRL